ncbi:hypothetical protein ABB37_06293 [Leptomonas pyrrhocoris]|uniref:BAR domain-containing protein n=1 Tax=Leptomonas pyrrhocoris TaxID=157538 RepID=A0A0M9FXF9_LEPPY|nr:hypothetical protein ABB37_06293 [Leptomonas pyrrhocoris]KPA78100.1 hypothetical protein ABB37_06293 [Leptomonas pyrrhocoris]|eukprot:XP_015656539.1 hypothetical protein ABB37_06293 [Leptomonas pyrrhocoris]
MLKIKTVLKLGPKTKDEEYDRRKNEMKTLGSAMRAYKSAMERAKSSMKRVVETWADVRKAFDALSDDVNVPDSTRDCTLALTASMDRIEGSLLPEYMTVMDSNVIPATSELSSLYDECGKLENSRNKLMHEYDVYRNEVAKKESEYQRKSKDISTSKSYGSEVAKRDRLEADFGEADQKFKDTHAHLMQNRAIACSAALYAFVDCSATFMEGVASEFTALKGSSQQALQAVRYGAQMEYNTPND